MKRRKAPEGVRSYSEAHQRRKKWLTAVACMAALVVFCTVYALMMPAAALDKETYCGKAEHTHTEECYESVLTCGLEENEEHTHDESCYEEVLVCDIPEHTHTEECYVNPEEAEAEEDLADNSYLQINGIEIPEGYNAQYTAQNEEEGFSVTVYAPEGAVPEDAVLSAALLSENDDAYAEAEAALAEEAGENSDYSFAAMDIHFETDGQEVEPEGDVYVVIDAYGLLPEGVDPESVTVQHHAEKDDGVTVETVADTADETEGVVTVTENETEAVADVNAVFGVNEFSIFTITWHGSWENHLSVRCVDEEGNEIGGGLYTLNIPNSSDQIEISNNAPEIKNYIYQKAVIADTSDGLSSGSEVSSLRYSSNSGWKYKPSNSKRWSDVGAKTIYLVYQKLEDVDDTSDGLTRIATVDSTAEGVHMYMFDYPAKEFAGGEYGTLNGSIKQGLASAKLDESGWPSLTGEYSTTKDTSFSQFFGGSTSAFEVDEGYAVNHLFLQDNYNKNGEFYYSAFENFASLRETNDGNFTVYQELGTTGKQNSETYYFRRGNFMPYNTLNKNYVRNNNYYNDTGQKLSADAERYGEPLYGFNESEDNFYFGMYLWADFYQPQNGEVEDNPQEGQEPATNPMRFEFTGDDDMWVYIDGVLVLDLGGIHDAQSGYIDFSTGEVRWTATTTDSDNANWQSPTTLKAIFEKVGMGSSTDWKGDTFADGSYHRIQIFYMERGAGASNLKIRFNLKTIPDGQLSVRKNVENYYAPQLADTTYTMQVMVDGFPYSEMPYTIFGTDQTGETDKSGCLNLKNNQTAVFADLTVGNKIQVKEMGASDTEEGSEISDRYDIDCSVADSSGAPVAGSSVENGVATATMPAYGSIVVTVTNTATFTRPLMLVKNFSGTEDNSPPENFQATYFLYEVDADGYLSKEPVGSICYSDMTKSEDGKSASYIFWLDVDKKYTIVEDFGDNDNKGETADLKWKKVIVETNDPAEGTDSNEGIVYLEKADATLLEKSESNPVDTITMTNYYGAPTIDITVTKVDSADNAIRLPNAEFYVSRTVTTEGENAEDVGGSTVYYKYDEENGKTTWVNSQDDATKLISAAAEGESHGTFTLHGLADGSYTLIEVKAPDGYQLPTSDFTFTVSEGKVISSGGGSDNNMVTVTNTTGQELPETGGPGTTLMSISGLLMAAAAVGGGYGLRRRRGKEGR